MTIKDADRDIKVCHVTSAHPRHDIRIFYKECISLAKNGFDLTLLVNDDMYDEVLEGVKIKSTKFKPQNRVERMIKSRKTIKEKITEINADIYHFHDPELLPIAKWVKKAGKKVIFDFHEDVEQLILFKSWIPPLFRKIASIFYKYYEKSSVKNFDAIVSVTPKFIERLIKINPRTYMITNYPKLSEFNDLKITKRNSICFAGGLSDQWNHLNIIKALEKVENNITYILAGSGNREYFSSLKNLKCWDRVNYFGRIPHTEVRNLYEESFAGMTLLKSQTQVGNEGTLGNTKIFEFMDAGLPIICSNNKIWKEIVETYQCGIAINPESIEEIKTAIEYLYYNPEIAKEMGIRGRKAVEEKYNWALQEKVLIGMYKRL
jgi:glycosyltransferase involved in cell wall biosynthesis